MPSDSRGDAEHVRSGEGRQALSGTSALALALAAIYVLPLYAPPEAGTTAAETGRIARLFPGVPAAWILVRLGALALAVVLFGSALQPTSTPRSPPAAATEPPKPLRPHFLWWALALALGLALASLGIGRARGSVQLAFVMLLLGPALLVHLAHRRRRAPWRWLSALAPGLGLFALWAGVRVAGFWGDARAATPVDTWQNFTSLESAVATGSGLLSGRFEPGASDLVHLLTGATLLSAIGRPPTFLWVQMIELAWLVATLVPLALLATRIAGAPAALVATAVVLFSPATQFYLFTPPPFALATAFTTWLIFLLHRLRASQSPAALVGLGTLGGLCLAFGQTAVPAAFVGAATAVTIAMRWRAVSKPTLAIAIACLCAASLPVIPGVEELQAIRTRYLERFLPWELTEAVLFGQVSPFVLTGAGSWAAPAGQWLDIVAGTLLAPLATPRTALRLWGDTFIEPIGVCLAVAGATMVAFGRARGAAGTLVGFIAIALALGFTSSYDRASLIRILALPVAMALLAAVGFTGIAGRNRRTAWPAALAGSALIAASGLWIFDAVNPRILARSWVSIAIDAAADAPQEAILLDYGRAENLSWLNVAVMAQRVPRTALRTLAFADRSSLPAATELVPEPIFLWSPALEADEGVAQQICTQWPDARLFVMRDPAGISTAWGATVARHWYPALHPTRWTEHACAGADAPAQDAASGRRAAAERTMRKPPASG